MTLEEFMGNQNSQDKIYTNEIISLLKSANLEENDKEFILAALKAINKGKDYGK